MSELLLDRLKTLDAKYAHKKTESRHLRVYYGWSRINKQQRREAIDVAFENMDGAGSEERRFIKTLRKSMDIVAVRDQTPLESMMAAKESRMFTVYHVFLNEKGIDGSLKRAILINRRDDEGKGIPEEKLEEIAKALEEHFLAMHPHYQEPELPEPVPYAD